MKIWIDLANSPQVLFFRPIIQELQHRGHDVVVTTRDFAQTVQLANLYSLKHTTIGNHGGKSLSNIGLKIIERAGKLMSFARQQHFDLAFSHNSYAQALAALSLSIPFITTMDYEHQPANYICFRIAKRVIVPEYFPVWALEKYGATNAKTIKYHGLKEQVYLEDFLPISDFLVGLNIPLERIIVVMRPPGTWGLYHNFENPLFDQVLKIISDNPESLIIFLPRVASQAEAVISRKYFNVIVPSKAIDGPNLLHYADLVISGGGTMNREAAVLGTPTYSIFKGKLASVDSFLIDQGRMTHISSENDIQKISLCKKQPRPMITRGKLIQEITDAILIPL